MKYHNAVRHTHGRSCKCGSCRPANRARDGLDIHRVQLAKFPADSHEVQRVGNDWVVFALTDKADLGEVRDEMTAGVARGDPEAAVRAQERQGTGDGASKLIRAINERNAAFWRKANGGGR